MRKLYVYQRESLPGHTGDRGCDVYRIGLALDSDFICPKCGQNTMEAVSNAGHFVYIQCSECGYETTLELDNAKGSPHIEKSWGDDHVILYQNGEKICVLPSTWTVEDLKKKVSPC